MAGGTSEPLIPETSRSTVLGVNTRFFPLDLRENEAVQLENIDTSSPGVAATRGGSNIAATGITLGPILALSEFKPDTGVTELLAVSPGGSFGDHMRLWKWDGSGSVFSSIGVLSGYTGIGTDLIDIVVGYDLHHTSNHVALISSKLSGVLRWVYDGTTLFQAHYGDSGNQPDGPVLEFASDNRAYATGTGAKRNRIYLSDVASWTVTGFGGSARSFEMGGGTKQEVVAIKSFRQYERIIFMSDRIERLFIQEQVYQLGQIPLFTAVNRDVIHTAIGCGSRRSVVSAGQDILFADQYGNIRSVARTIQDSTQGVTSSPVSEKIQAWIDRINPTAIDKIACQTYDRWVLVGLPIDQEVQPSHVFALDMPRTAQHGEPVWDGPWQGDAFKFRSSAVAALDGASANADRNPTLYLGGAATTGGFVYRGDSGNDDSGSPIAFRQTTRRHTLGDFSLEKSWRRLRTFSVSSAGVTMMVEANPDARGWQTVGFVPLTGGEILLPQTLPFFLGGDSVSTYTLDLQQVAFERSNDIQFRFTATSTSLVQFLGYQLLGNVENYDWSLGQNG